MGLGRFELPSRAPEALKRADFQEISLNWEDFQDWLKCKYSKEWAERVFQYAKKYHGMFNGSLRELDSFGKYKKNNVLKSLIALSKYLGVHEQFKEKISSYGIKWERGNSLEAFLRMMNVKEGLIDWVKACMKDLTESEATFTKFALITGLRKGEAIDSFNLIIKLSQDNKLNDYCNQELESLEHFRFENTFIRGSKNAFFSFIPKEMIQQIASCKPISYSALKKHLWKHGMKARFNELRDYFATFMVHNGLIKEEADLLQGRIGMSIFMRHYFSPAIKELRDRTLSAVKTLDQRLT